MKSIAKRNKRIAIQDSLVTSDLKQKMLYALLMLATLAAYYLVYANKMFPYTEGWGIHYVELMKQGQIPYRHFYFYLPPLNLLVDSLFWNLSGGVFYYYRLLRLAERLLMMLMIYLGLTRFFKPRYVWIACLLGGILGAHSTYDLMGDYTQTGEFMLILVGLVAGNFVTSTGKKRLFWLFTCGFLIGCAFFMKQPHGVAALLVYALFLIYFCVVEKDKNFLFYCLATLIGFLVPIGLCCVWLAANDALKACIKQVFVDTGSKGSLFSIIFESPLFLITGSEGEGSKYLIDFAVFMLGVCILRYMKRQNGNTSAKQKFWVLLLTAGIVYYYYFRYAENLQLLFSSISSSVLSLLIIATCIALILSLLARRFLPKLPVVSQCIWVAWGVFLAWCVATNRQNLAYAIHSSKIRDFVDTLIYISTYFVVGITAYVLVLRVVKKQWVIPLKLLVVIVAGIASSYATVMASASTGFPSRSMFFCMPIVLCFLYTAWDKKAWHTVLYVVSLLLCVISLAQKVEVPYSWWGWTDESIQSKTVTSQIPALKGFYFSENERDIYEETCKLISENTKEGDSVVCIPHTPIFNLLTDRYNENGFVPVTFFDVCADNYASDEAKRFSGNPPKLVVWCDLTSSAWTIHEQYFRGGDRLGQRDIQEWMYSMVENGRYRLIGQVGNLFVYLLNDGTPVKHTFFQSASAENSTLDASVLRRAKDDNFSLKGSGTQEDPYLIEGLISLCAFRDMVNNGETFENKVVRQNCDIDLQDIDNWEPIGSLEKGFHFAGIYDGAGYSIRNMRIRGLNNAGLFGYLSGQIYNLELMNCDIEGLYNIGALVSHAKGTGAKIINCITSGKISCRSRAGGIADNFTNGIIANSFSTCTINAPAGGSLVGYGAGKIWHCLNDEAANLANLNVPSIQNSTKTLNADPVFWNEGVQKWIDQYGGDGMAFCEWTYNEFDGQYRLNEDAALQTKGLNPIWTVLAVIAVVAVLVALNFGKIKNEWLPRLKAAKTM